MPACAFTIPHIVPAGMTEGIPIDLPQRMLSCFRRGEPPAAYPVALGKPEWPTPEAEFRIVAQEGLAVEVERLPY